MKKPMEFHEDAHERFEASMHKLLNYTPPSKKAKELPKSEPKPVR